MSKIRINDLARELEVKSREILDVLTTVGVTEKKTHSSSLEDHEADLVRKHLRGRSDASPSSARTSRAPQGDDGIKTKIDLSNISRPGDVLRAITQQKGAAEAPVARPVVKPPLTTPAAEAKTETLAAPAAPKAFPPKPASEAPAPPAPRMVTPASVAATYRPPTVVVIPPKIPLATSPAATSAAPPAIAVPPRIAAPAAPVSIAPPAAQPPAQNQNNVTQMQSAAPARPVAPVAPPP
jgi:translation initiation factor IF-2